MDSSWNLTPSHGIRSPKSVLNASTPMSMSFARYDWYHFVAAGFVTTVSYVEEINGIMDESVTNSQRWLYRPASDRFAKCYNTNLSQVD